MFRAEKMMPTDFPFAVELANMLEWEMADVDFEYMSMLEPDGCFVLWQGRERVGMATCVSYGRVGWFGNLAVKPKSRRKGAGTFLVNHAVEYLKNRNVETIGLYAYQHLVEFYGGVGFKSGDEFAVLNGTVTKAHSNQSQLAVASQKDTLELSEFDSKCMSWDRRRLFESMLTEEDNLCYCSTVNSEILGFVMAKVYGDMAEIGPLMCERNQKHVALELVETTLSKLGGLEVYAYVPVNETALLDFFQEAGLRERFRVTRMFLGSIAAESCIYLPESLERG